MEEQDDPPVSHDRTPAPGRRVVYREPPGGGGGRRASPWLIALVALLVVGVGGFLLLGVAVAALAGGGGGAGAVREEVMSGTAPEKIAVVDLTGVIAEQSLFFGGGPDALDRMRRQLRHAGQDGDVKALIVRIDSPGGTMTASDIMYHELQEFKKRAGVKVVACMMGTCASGGVYVAAAADKVLAHPTTITGSLGVIMSGFHDDGLLEKIGVKNETYKAGRLKDMGSMFRPPTDEERRRFEALLAANHDRFIKVVAAGRNLPEEIVRAHADGSICSAEEAREWGLVDQVGYFADAVAMARSLASLGPEARVVEYHRQPSLGEMLFARSAAAGAGAGGDGGAPLSLTVALNPQALLAAAWPRLYAQWSGN
ncbi:MAG: signal peptide peptidase SppA [Planctomycetes bacterium]|nr:signal peptide peptidase SppA [Planctomycetota bacterium]